VVAKSTGGTDSSGVPAIQTLLTEYRDRTGDSYDEMARKVDDAIGRQRFQQLVTRPPTRMPYDSKTVHALARLLGVDTTTVVLAYAQSLGLPVERTGSQLAHLLPSGVDQLTREDMDALLHVVRQMVAVRQAATKAAPDASSEMGTVRELRPPQPDLSQVAARSGDSEGRTARKRQDEDAERGEK
jgi:hypothetical protein